MDRRRPTHRHSARRCDAPARGRLPASLRYWCGGGLLAGSLLCGCQGRSVQVDNPVVGPPPPRVNSLSGDASGSEVAVAQLSTIETEDVPLTEASVLQTAHAGVSAIEPQDAFAADSELTEVIARVNGNPIFASEITERYGARMAQARAQLPSVEYLKLRNQIIERDLPAVIDQAILVDALKSTLTSEQVASLEGQLDEAFEQQIAAMQAESGIDTLPELELRLQEEGTTLSKLRSDFANQQLASQYLAAKLESPKSVSRPQLLAYYQEHLDDYRQPAQVKWQQIWLSTTGADGRAGAVEKLDKVIAELRSNAEFDEVARRYSDGVMASDGGHWDWTEHDSIADPDVARALFELRVGEISQVFSHKNSLQIVKVTSRRPERVTPFEEVQDDIRDSLTADARRTAAKQILDELRDAAVVEKLLEQPADNKQPPISLISDGGEDPSTRSQARPFPGLD